MNLASEDEDLEAGTQAEPRGVKRGLAGSSSAGEAAQEGGCNKRARAGEGGR